MGYASVDPQPASDVIIPDEPFIQAVAEALPPPEATWGAITGTLSEQTDLSGALDGKETAGAVASHELSFTHANIATAYDHNQAAHAPSNAQKNSDILKSEIEAVLTGELTSHSHAGGGGGLTHPQIMSRIFLLK